MACRIHLGHQPGRRHRAGRLAVAGGRADPGPLLVALAGLLQRLPWLLFGLSAGVLADRVDCRLLVVAVDLVRTAALAVLTVALVTGAVHVTVVLVTVFMLGMAEVFAGTTAGALLPMVVPGAISGSATRG